MTYRKKTIQAIQQQNYTFSINMFIIKLRWDYIIVFIPSLYDWFKSSQNSTKMWNNLKPEIKVFLKYVLTKQHQQQYARPY